MRQQKEDGKASGTANRQPIRNRQGAAAKEKLRASGNTPSFRNFHMWLNGQKPASPHQAKTPVKGAASVPGEARNAAAKPFSLDTIKKRFLFFHGKRERGF